MPDRGGRATVRRGLVRRLQRTVAEKRSLAAAVRSLAHHLEPGLWRLPFARVAVRARSGRLPRHLRATGAVGSSGRRAALAQAIRVLVPPTWVWVSAPRAVERDRGGLGMAAGPSTALVLAPAGRSAVLFDRAGAIVTRVGIGRPLPARQVAIRRAMQPYVPMPEFSVSPDRHLLREAMLDGLPFHRLSTERRSVAFVALCGRYAAMVRPERRSARPAAVAHSFRAMAALADRDAAWAPLLERRDAAVREAAAWPCVPVHGDLSAENVVVVDGVAHLIDFEFADLLPFFYDVVKLVLDEASCGRDDLLAGIGSPGPIREAWCELWTAAGSEGPPESLEVVLTTVVALYARRLQRIRPGQARRPVLEGTRDVSGLGGVPHV